MFFVFCFFSVQLLSVLHGHLFFSSPSQRPMTSAFKGFSIPDLIHYIYFPILILEKRASIFPFECLMLNKGTTGTFLKRLWYDAVLDWGLNPGLEASTVNLILI